MALLDLLRDSFIVGIDIVKPGIYAYAVTINNVTVEKGQVSDVDLLKIIKKYRPLVLAIDNLRELLDIGRLFIKRLAKLPFSVHIVQVTRVGPGVEVCTEELAREYLGIDVQKLDPEETAEVLTRLVLKGVGSIVRLYEPETKIIIKARLGTKEGGMSRVRYERNIRHRIKQLVEEISRKLDQEGLDYDLFFTDSEGVRSATFIVYADKSIVRRLVKPLRSMDVNVIIEQVMSDTIKFSSLAGEETLELKPSDKYIIVGVDPGIVTGVAVLDLNGRVLALHSGRNLSRRKVLDIVYRYGTPVMVATDVAKVPDYVKKLSSMTNSVLYSPDRDLTVTEKSEIVSKICQEQKIQVKDPHQRDALAAAYKAYLAYKNKLEKAQEEVRKLNAPIPLDEVKVLVIRGLSIKQAIDTVLKRMRKSGEYKIIVVKEQDTTAVQKAEELERRVRLLETEVEKLLSEKRELEEKLNEAVSRAYVEARRDIMVRSLQSRITQLETELERSRQRVKLLERELEKMRDLIEKMLLTDELVIVPRLDIYEKSKIKHGVTYMYSINDLSHLENMDDISIIVVEVDPKDKIRRKAWIEYSKIIITLDELKDSITKICDRILVVNKEKLEEACNRLKERYNNELTEDTLEKLVSEYRYLRSKMYYT
ncbi:MAG: DUF460 domain-containing protein [Crenarchaeota archaeon]|nr:DUF460 domain-containing protein [Thermoproteota archaeon]